MVSMDAGISPRSFSRCMMNEQSCCRVRTIGRVYIGISCSSIMGCLFILREIGLVGVVLSRGKGTFLKQER